MAPSWASGQPTGGVDPPGRRLPEILRGARGGGPQAWRAVYERYQKLVYAACLSAVGHGGLADDAAAETWLEVMRRPPVLRSDAGLGSWLYVVARRTSLRLARAERRQKELPRTLALAHSPSPSTSAAAVLESLPKLPASLRAPLLLHTLGGLSYRECARVLRLPIGTVCSRIASARRALLASPS